MRLINNLRTGIQLGVLAVGISSLLASDIEAHPPESVTPLLSTPIMAPAPLMMQEQMVAGLYQNQSVNGGVTEQTQTAPGRSQYQMRTSSGTYQVQSAPGMYQVQQTSGPVVMRPDPIMFSRAPAVGVENPRGLRYGVATPLPFVPPNNNIYIRQQRRVGKINIRQDLRARATGFYNY